MDKHIFRKERVPYWIFYAYLDVDISEKFNFLYYIVDQFDPPNKFYTYGANIILGRKGYYITWWSEPLKTGNKEAIK